MNFSKQLSLKLKFFFGSLFYLKYVPHSFLYSRKRDRLEREFAPPPPCEGFNKPGKLLQAEPKQRGARFYFEQAELEVSFLVSDLVRIEWFPGIPPISYAIARSDWPEVETTLNQTDDSWTVSSSDSANPVPNALTVIVGVDGSVKFCDLTGQTLREELPPQRQGERWIHQAQLRNEEHIYGLGERAAPLNLRVAKETTEKGEVCDSFLA